MANGNDLNSQFDKRWFVYMGDHHEGPFSADEIRQKLAAKTVTEQHYFWREGMPDWLPLPEISELHDDGPNAPLETPALPVEQPVIEFSPAHESSPIMVGGLISAEMPAVEGLVVSPSRSEEPSFSALGAGALSAATEHVELSPAFEAPSLEAPASEPALSLTSVSPAEGSEHTQEIPVPLDSASADSTESATKRGDAKRSRLIYALLGLVVAGGLTAALQLGVLGSWTKSFDLEEWLAKVPGLSSFFSPLQSIPELTPEQMQPLKAAAKAHLKSDGIRVELVVLPSTPPTLYFASNLPDGVSLEVRAVGEGETLLNRFEFTATGRTTVTKRLAALTGLKGADGSPAPAGRYQLNVVLGPTQDPAVQAELSAVPGGVPAVVMTRTVFLGGQEKDPQYLQRLSQYHETLRAEAEKQRQELTEYVQTLSQVFNQAIEKYTALSKAPKKVALKKAWETYYEKFQAMNAQMQPKFSTWTPEETSKLIYGPLFPQLKDASESLVKMLEFMNGFITKPSTEASEFQSKLVELHAATKDKFSALSASLESLAKAPPSPSGMPPRLETKL